MAATAGGSAKAREGGTPYSSREGVAIILGG